MEAKAKLDQSGWLQKEGGDLVKSWKKRWFCIEKGDLAYYKKEGKQGEVGRIPLAAAQIERSSYKKYCFQLSCPLDKRVYHFLATSDHEVSVWVKSLTKVADAHTAFLKKQFEEEKLLQQQSAPLSPRGHSNVKSAGSTSTATPLSPRAAQASSTTALAQPMSPRANVAQPAQPTQSPVSPREEKVLMEEYESSEHEYDYDQFMDIKKTIVDDNVEKFLELIKTAKSVNMKDPIDCDNTFLHYAVLHKNQKAVYYLIERRARQYENSLGETPASLAYKAQKEDSSFFHIHQYLQYRWDKQQEQPRKLKKTSAPQPNSLVANSKFMEQQRQREDEARQREYEQKKRERDEREQRELRDAREQELRDIRAREQEQRQRDEKERAERVRAQREKDQKERELAERDRERERERQQMEAEREMREQQRAERENQFERERNSKSAVPTPQQQQEQQPQGELTRAQQRELQQQKLAALQQQRKELRAREAVDEQLPPSTATQASSMPRIQRQLTNEDQPKSPRAMARSIPDLQLQQRALQQESVPTYASPPLEQHVAPLISPRQQPNSPRSALQRSTPIRDENGALVASPRQRDSDAVSADVMASPRQQGDVSERFLKTVLASLLKCIAYIGPFKQTASDVVSAKEVTPLIAKYKAIKEEADKLKPFVADVVEEIKKWHDRTMEASKGQEGLDALGKAREMLATGLQSMEMLLRGVADYVATLNDNQTLAEIGKVLVQLQKCFEDRTS